MLLVAVFASSAEHEFTRECRSVKNSLRSATLIANTTIMTESAELCFSVIRDRLKSFGDQLNTMTICKDEFYPRFWESAGKFSGERDALSRIGDEIKSLKQRIILIKAQWECEAKHLAIVERFLQLALVGIIFIIGYCIRYKTQAEKEKNDLAKGYENIRQKEQVQLEAKCKNIQGVASSLEVFGKKQDNLVKRVIEKDYRRHLEELRD
jgi:hypothetical protein